VEGGDSLGGRRKGLIGKGEQVTKKSIEEDLRKEKKKNRNR